MLTLYSLNYTVAMALMSPLLLLRREKYGSGFQQRLGHYPAFSHDGREVIWLHCVSVGETNAARPLVDGLIKRFPDRRLVVSTVTKTGQELAQKIFADKADAVFYLPFEWKFSVRRALENYKPSLLLLMETEIWPRLINEAAGSGTRIAIVNGRLSDRSFTNYLRFRTFMGRVLSQVDRALMQTEKDAERIKKLGIDDSKVSVTGNVKFDAPADDPSESAVANELRQRFGIDGAKPLIIAASTHEPEERYVVEALEGPLGSDCRLMIAPRRPDRFDEVARLLERSPYRFARRSAAADASDVNADIILLDSIGELRSSYALADIVFVGGSLIRHGGQSILEPAAAGKAIITGPHTHNFTEAVSEFLRRKALIQIPDGSPVDRLVDAFSELIEDPEHRLELGRNAFAAVESNRGATARTIALLSEIAGS